MKRFGVNTLFTMLLEKLNTKALRILSYTKQFNAFERTEVVKEHVE